MKVGLFFGSFNPIHVGHLIIANAMAYHADLEQVWFVVSPQNPFKKSKSLLHEFDRYDMVQMAIDDNPRFRVTDIEFKLPRPSYTIDTLTYIQEKYPQHAFRLIIGGDNLEQFKNWKNYDKILEYYGLYVYPRPGSEVNELVQHPNVQVVNAPLMDISATFIRECIRDNKSIKYLVPDRIEEYIVRKKFYL
ncbi:nicotinate (nicotinamide) nucleotide adenylyltransferase [Cytophagaceae bacterium DM2B3-1]|uniref:Probable nicotinate-nucleotide adenylyltransferase n=1 Tax=Xanthocytophaga flava TaxID=3048013 RepID=A0AAE3QP18_9BACT|nr:nicotinate (nicotinamide) nucleotide adenylyltransferase [Xanthocytophaga flavus]MDJ1468528.1 nicotinate (nicotinamide) nucleotide adenylyltransferase [Xanthocytophaga flavus]MDJ1480595.1 nicotinate (nicotinamide) nucleotide adenylyltransferase [Xanthocytophaga flavus]MDJ1493423.1 nicotinate (nicotinamide) nucleotide adenylyltransferase [Xanthocytophaga flavus]